MGNNSFMEGFPVKSAYEEVKDYSRINNIKITPLNMTVRQLAIKINKRTMIDM